MYGFVDDEIKDVVQARLDEHWLRSDYSRITRRICPAPKSPVLCVGLGLCTLKRKPPTSIMYVYNPSVDFLGARSEQSADVPFQMFCETTV